MSISLRRRLVAAAAGAVAGLGLVAPVAGRAAVPMENGCRLMAPSTIACRYIARGNGRWASATDSPWVITVLHDRRVRAVANRASNGSVAAAPTGTFSAAPGDVVTVRFDAMVPAGMLWSGDA
jgi:hypothetical protein